VLDVHAHILPAIDDGVKSLEDSMEVLSGLSNIGFTHVVATPHFYPGRYKPSFQSVFQAAAQVKAALMEKKIPVEILLGRECFLDYELLTSEDRATFPFTWNRQKYQLIELPQITVPKAIATYLETLQKTGIVPILAHAERYNRVIRDPEQVHEYLEMGFRIQIDAASFSPSAHKALRTTALAILKSGRVDLVASDIHRPSQLEDVRLGIEFLRNECGEAQVKRFYELA